MIALYAAFATPKAHPSSDSACPSRGHLLRNLCVLFVTLIAVTAQAAEHGFNAPTQGRNVSSSFKRYAAKSQLIAPAIAGASTSSSKSLAHGKNLNIEPAVAKPACAKPLRIDCTLDFATSATPASPALIQLELTPLKEALPVTPYLKPKHVTVRRNTVVVAYTFR